MFLWEFFLLKPSSVFCGSVVRSVLVEWEDRNPCCERAREMCRVVLRRTKRAITLDGVQRIVFGHCEPGSVNGLFRFVI